MSNINNTDFFTGIFMNSGKGVNDLGNYEGCKATPGLKHATIRITDLTTINLYVGLCIPSDCTTADTAVVAEGMTAVVADSGLVVEINFTDPEDTTIPTYLIAGSLLTALFLCVIAVGTVVQYTALLNKPEHGSKIDNPEVTKTQLGKFFLSFAIYRNIKKIFYTPQAKPNDHLTILNGIRFMSILWVIMGHAFVSIFLYPASNLSELASFVNPWWFEVISAGVFAVDVFFFLSAFLGAYLLISKPFDKSVGGFLVVYFHRIFRLLPPILLLTCIFLIFYKELGDGPIWGTTAQTSIDLCVDQWWYNALFVNNVLPASQPSGCFAWLWYVANDMQFFLILPFQVMAFKKHRYIGYATTLVILGGNIFCVFLISGINE